MFAIHGSCGRGSRWLSESEISFVVRRHPHDLLVEVARMAVDRAVHRVHERRRQERPEREAHQPGVVVDDVEVVVPREAVERVLELPERLADPLARRLLEDGRQLARVRESPEAKSVTSWPASASPSASSETIHSIPP